MKTKFLVYLLIGLVSSVIVLTVFFIKIDFLNSLDLKLKDARFRLRGSIEPDNRIFIVAIDSESIDRLGRWPWDRKIIAKLIEKLGNVKAIALDIVFSEASSSESDSALSKALNRSNIIVGYYFREEKTEINPQSYMNLSRSRIKILKTSENLTTLPIREFPYAELNIPSIKAEAGFFNITPDNDGVYRRLNILAIYKGELYPNLVLKAMEKFLNKPLIVEIAPYGVEAIKIGTETIPVDEKGLLTINYYGERGSIRTVSAFDVIEGKITLPEDAIVFIGATELGIADIRATPFDPVMPGVEISATVASNILKKDYLKYNSWTALIDIAIIVLSALFLSLILVKIKRTLISLGIFTGMLVAYYSLNILFFKKYLLNLSIIYPLISLSLCYLASEAYRNIIVEKRSRFLKKAFSSYVSPELVNIIIKNPDKLKLGGEKRTITVLFSDIRDFTTISESLDPEKLVILLNNYLDPMTEIVLKHRGMLDKYIGDAIMAVYNAPVELKEHAREALLTSLEMLKKLTSLNEKFATMGFPKINIGVGINTGEAITGNMGTEKRFDYTAIGDTVNLASRLEGLNKFYGTKIIISESTFNRLENKKQFFIRQLDLIRVKGKKAPVKIYEVMEEDSPLVSVINDFEKALHLYRDCMFKEALKLFTSINEECKDQVSLIYVKRCEDYILNPPPSDWDRVYTAKEK